MVPVVFHRLDQLRGFRIRAIAEFGVGSVGCRGRNAISRNAFASGSRCVGQAT